MTALRHKIKGYVAGFVAFIACPCHLPFTLPLLISLTAGTAFSAWLAAPRNVFLVGTISTVIFIGGMALAFKWFNQPHCPLASVSVNRRSPHAQSQD